MLLTIWKNLRVAEAIILVDELDLHLHPRWQMRIVKALRDAFPRVQFVTTTHQPLCLKGLQQGEIVVLDRDVDTDQVYRIADLPDPDGMRAEQMYLSEFFGLNSTDPKTDARILKAELLARKVDRTDAEEEEFRALEAEIKKKMKVGNSLDQQIYSQAMFEKHAKSFSTPRDVRATPRRALADSIKQKFAMPGAEPQADEE